MLKSIQGGSRIPLGPFRTENLVYRGHRVNGKQFSMLPCYLQIPTIEPVDNTSASPTPISMIKPNRYRRRKNYDDGALERGVRLFYSGLSMRGAARQVGVPEATLRKKIKEGTCS